MQYVVADMTGVARGGHIVAGSPILVCVAVRRDQDHACMLPLLHALPLWFDGPLEDRSWVWFLGFCWFGSWGCTASRDEMGSERTRTNPSQGGGSGRTSGLSSRSTTRCG